jgi:hypothetical protein
MKRSLRFLLMMVALATVATADAQQATDPRVADLVRAGKLRVALFLPQHYEANLLAMAVPKHQAGRLAYFSEFIEEAKASGLVQRAIERAGRPGIRVAPPGNPTARK